MSDWQELGRRAVACKGWRWMPGMLALPPKADRCQRDGQIIVGRLPDLSDPATLGCLLALVREAWGDPHVYVLACASDWFTVCSPNAEGGKWIAHPPIDGSTEAEALVVALDAAP